MALENYKKIIANTIAKGTAAGTDPAEIAEAVITRVKLAMEIADDIELPAQESPVRMQTALKPAVQPPGPIVSTPQREFGGSALIIGEAPPTAQGLSGTAPVTHNYHTQEELTALIGRSMPLSLTLQLPGFDKPLELFRKLQQPPYELQRDKDGNAAAGWVRVMYAQKNEDYGPFVQVLTTDEKPDFQALKNEIAQAAQGWYSKEQRKLEPRSAPPVRITDADIDAAIQRDRAMSSGQESFSGEAQQDAKVFRRAVEEKYGSVDNWSPR